MMLYISGEIFKETNISISDELENRPIRKKVIVM